MAFYNDGPGRSRAEFSVPAAFQGYAGVVHGGVVAAILDEAAGRTVMGEVNPRRVVVTGRMDIRYRRPVPVKQPLVISGQLLRESGLVVNAHSKIEDKQGELLAEADVTLMEIPPALKNRVGWDAADWQVYPDREELE